MFVYNPLYVNVFFVVICCCFLLKEKIQRYNFFSIAPKNVSFCSLKQGAIAIYKEKNTMQRTDRTNRGFYFLKSGTLFLGFWGIR